MHRHRMVVWAIGWTALALGASAQRGVPLAELPALDANGDGMVSREEFAAVMQGGLEAFAAQDDGRGPEDAWDRQLARGLMASFPPEVFEAAVRDVLQERHAKAVAGHHFFDPKVNASTLRLYSWDGKGREFDEASLRRLVAALIEAPLRMHDLDGDGRISLADVVIGERRSAMLMGEGAPPPNPQDRNPLAGGGNRFGGAKELLAKVTKSLAKAGPISTGETDREGKPVAAQPTRWRLDDVRKALLDAELIEGSPFQAKAEPDVVLRKSAELDLQAWLSGDAYDDDLAEFGYTRDYDAKDGAQAGVQAALLFPRVLSRAPNAWLLDPSVLVGVGGMEMKMAGSGSTRTHLTTAVLGVSGFWEQRVSDAEFSGGSQAAAWVGVTHDAEKRSELLTFNGSWRPVIPQSVFGSYQSLGNSGIDLRIDLSLRAQWRDVWEAGSNEELATFGDALRLGHTIDVRLRPNGEQWKAFVLKLQYTYFAAISGDGDETEHLSAALEFKTGKWHSVILGYEEGAEALTDSEVHQLQLSVGLKL